MSDARQEARELLRELITELRTSNGNGHSDPAPTPQVPPPPVAAVHRPSTWGGPAEPGAIVGDGAPVEPAAGTAEQRATHSAGAAEHVTIGNDADLDRFVRALAQRLANPAEREAILAGRTRFTLGQPTAPHAVRIDKGAVTERAIREAARNGQRLVLGRGAVLTPLARDQARRLRVHIEKEHT